MEYSTNEITKVTLNYPTIKFVKHDLRAITPTRAHASDIGYDLTAIDVFKVVSNKIILYETGISVKPPKGYYLEILPRSSLSKTGYILANSVGTIDPHYTGTLKIAVIKVDPTLPDLELPFCKFQLVVRSALYFDLEEVSYIDETIRGAGCFGSTDGQGL